MLNIKLSKIIKSLLALLLINLQACTPMIHPAPAPTSLSSGQLLNDFFVTADGTRLPLKKWQPHQQKVSNIIIALHGFNDYSNFFRQPGSYFSQHNTLSYAYDQRGFGRTPNRGSWAGVDTLINDLECFTNLIRTHHPDTPIYLLGESMGGAVVISTLAKSNQLPIQGVILVAPAVWGRQTMPWYQNVLLWTLSHTVPWMTLSGNNLKITPSDNIEMLKALGLDPLVIKKTKVESIHGLVNLMDQALASANQYSAKTLLLYGEKDEIIPKKPTYQFLHNLNPIEESHQVIAFYENGYHMLLRDLQASILWDDITAWMNSFSTPLPSGADIRAQQLLN